MSDSGTLKRKEQSDISETFLTFTSLKKWGTMRKKHFMGIPDSAGSSLDSDGLRSLWYCSHFVALMVGLGANNASPT